MTNLIKYIIAIPSYKRENIILKNTINVLEEYNINPKIIYIFVADKKEYSNYLSTLPEKYHKNIIIGIKGLDKQRNFITNYFPRNKYIIQMDDDIRKIMIMINYNSKNRKENKTIKLRDLNSFIQDSYKELKKNKSYIWGV